MKVRQHAANQIPGVRVRKVEPPSLRRETFGVICSAAAIVLFSATHVLATRHPTSGPSLLPHQKRFRDLGNEEQRIFRALSEALLEAESFRFSRGHWPASADLAELFLPPFAPDPLDKAKRSWSSREDRSGVNYLGHDEQDPKKTAFLLLIQEADEKAPLGAALDEEHHQFPNGDLIHVSIWMRSPGGTIPHGVIADPKLAGWTQLVIAEAPSRAE